MRGADPQDGGDGEYRPLGRLTQAFRWEGMWEVSQPEAVFMRGFESCDRSQTVSSDAMGLTLAKNSSPRPAFREYFRLLQHRLCRLLLFVGRVAVFAQDPGDHAVNYRPDLGVIELANSGNGDPDSCVNRRGGG